MCVPGFSLSLEAKLEKTGTQRSENQVVRVSSGMETPSPQPAVTFSRVSQLGTVDIWGQRICGSGVHAVPHATFSSIPSLYPPAASGATPGRHNQQYLCTLPNVP